MQRQHLAQHVIGDADGAQVGNAVDRGQRLLDLGRIDVDSSGDDDVGRAAGQEQEALGRRPSRRRRR